MFLYQIMSFAQRSLLCDVFSAANKPKAAAEKMWRKPEHRSDQRE
jgi:hypothetical protein